jgi:hypothetical protein
METTIEIIFYALAPVIAALIAWLVGWIKAKTKFDVPESLVVKAIELAVRGVERAEAIAKAQTQRMASDSKLSIALAYVDNYANDNPKLKEYVKGHARGLVESVLVSRLTPDDMTPKGN